MTRTNTPVDHPGSFILEELEARGWAQVDLAYILGISPQQLSPLLSGARAISPDMAVSLGEAFDMPPEFFANLQKLYDLQHARPVDPGVKIRAIWASHFPVREMIRRGWIENTEPSLLDLQMLRFFEQSKIEDVPFVGNARVAAHAPKKTGYDGTTAPQYAWLFRVRKIAEQIKAPPYSEPKLRNALKRIRAHMIDKDDLVRIPHILLDCGVRVVFVEHLPASKIDGVCVWINDQPVIGLSLRLDRFDNFCFVLRHEIEHVLNQDGMSVSFTPVDEFTHGEEPTAEKPDYEEAADRAAADFCIPQDMLKSFIARKSPFISKKDIAAFASRMEINPAVVAGQLQKSTGKWHLFREFLVPVRSLLLGWEYKDGWGHIAPSNL